jgi:hypothetical protein
MVLPARVGGAVAARTSGVLGFRFELVSPDGDSVGSIETNELNLQAGDTVDARGGRRYRVTAVIPLALIQEFVDEPENGVLEVEPL